MQINPLSLTMTDSGWSCGIMCHSRLSVDESRSVLRPYLRSSSGWPKVCKPHWYCSSCSLIRDKICNTTEVKTWPFSFVDIMGIKAWNVHQQSFWQLSLFNVKTLSHGCLYLGCCCFSPAGHNQSTLQGGYHLWSGPGRSRLKSCPFKNHQPALQFKALIDYFLPLAVSGKHELRTVCPHETWMWKEVEQRHDMASWTFEMSNLRFISGKLNRTVRFSAEGRALKRK